MSEYCYDEAVREAAQPVVSSQMCNWMCEFGTEHEYDEFCDCQFYYQTKQDEILEATHDAAIREFSTGANRDLDTNKLDYEGFLSPLVLERFARYMHKNRTLKNGSTRDSDNWQKGMPQDVYMKSGWRHFMDWWKLHRGLEAESDVEDTLCALLFNVQGYLHERLTNREAK